MLEEKTERFQETGRNFEEELKKALGKGFAESDMSDCDIEMMRVCKHFIDSMAAMRDLVVEQATTIEHMGREIERLLGYVENTKIEGRGV